MYNPKIDIKDTSFGQVYYRGPQKGQPTGAKSWRIFFDNEERGTIFNPSKKRYQVMTKHFRDGFGAKYFKTYKGALNWLITYEKRFIPLGQALQGIYV